MLILVCINISWAHQMNLHQMVSINDYYSRNALAPYAFRVLPLALFNLLTDGRIENTGFPRPLSNTAEIFQLALDSISLFGTGVMLFLIAKNYGRVLTREALVLATLYLLIMVVFGYFIVPNLSLFYPYDFIELFFCAMMVFISTHPFKYDLIAISIALFFGALAKETILFMALVYLILRFNGRYLGAKSILTSLLFLAMFAASKYCAVEIAEHYYGGHIPKELFYNQLMYTVRQFKNPLFYFSMVGIFSYLYLPVLFIRKELDKIDKLLLIMIFVWMLIMANVGIVRELRIFSPMCVILFLVLMRHFDTLMHNMLGADRNRVS